jgi:hypothetical protein
MRIRIVKIKKEITTIMKKIRLLFVSPREKACMPAPSEKRPASNHMISMIFIG